MEGDKYILKIVLANGGFNVIKHNESSRVVDVVDILVNKLTAGNSWFKECYSLQVVVSDTTDPVWLTDDSLMTSIREKFESGSDLNKIRYELRIRLIPPDLSNLLINDRISYFYLYDQIREDYMKRHSDSVESSVALQLGCLEIRRLFKDMTHSALEKKSNMDFLEKDIGLHKFFPNHVLKSMKPKALRKHILTQFKKLGDFAPEDCVRRFLELLLHSHTFQFNTERYPCTLGPGSGWGIALTLLIGPEVHVSCVTSSDSKASPTTMAKFNQIDTVTFQRNETQKDRGFVQIRVIEADEPIFITTENLVHAEHIGSLIDGYCRFLDNGRSVLNTATTSIERPSYSKLSASPSILNKRDVKRIEKTKPSGLDYGLLDRLDNAVTAYDDYAIPADNFEIVRECLRIGDFLGEGQFGDVCRGTFIDPQTGLDQSVAIKTCKQPADEYMTDRFLQEAYIMQQFEHPHIIRLVGIVTSQPVLIVMELAEYGEIRGFLHANKDMIDISTLLLYCFQLSSAMAYLETLNFVHRDIAARNVLAFSKDLVKLGDFGMSRVLEDQCYYTASKGKLPIKWLSPESINFRRFTTASDVWMFGVCMWEIMMYGIKPFVGIKNNDVIGLIEAGERLKRPESCPKPLYDLMCCCWFYEPTDRPSFAEIKKAVQSLVDPSQLPSPQRYTLERESIDRQIRKSHSLSWSEQPPPKPVLPTGVSPSITCSSSQIQGSSAPQDRSNSCNNLTSSGMEATSTPKSTQYSTLSHSDAAHTLSERLFLQRIASDEDQKWLLSQQTADPLSHSNISASYSAPNRLSAASSSQTNSLSSVNSENDRLSGFNQAPQINLATSTSAAAAVSQYTQEVTSPQPTNQISPPIGDRSNDPVYRATTCLVRTVMEFTQRLPNVDPAQFIELVQDIGSALRPLLVSVDDIITLFPDEQSQKEIAMAHKVLSSDMAELIKAMKLAQEYSNTTLDRVHRNHMLKPAHIIAVDAKTLLDTVDSCRMKTN